MKHLTRVSTLGSMLLVLAAAAALASGEPAEAPDGILCLTPVLDTSYIAVRVAVSPVQALAGVHWFNNDGLIVFPRLLVADGQDQAAPNLELAQTVCDSIQGTSEAWSALALPSPIATDTGALYVIFQLPANCERTGQGSGGGPGIGYLHQIQTSPVYLSADGQDWARLNTGYRLLVEPVFEAREPGKAAFSKESNSAPITAKAATGPRLTTVFPNPSNPAVHVEFATGKSGPVALAVYDLRGRLVRTLLQAEVAPGTFVVDWTGEDDAGRTVASGVYFVQLKGLGELSNRRLTLVR